MKYLLSLLLLITLTACPGEDDGVHKGLPAATQEGLGTFGCYVNGELFVETGSYFNTFYQYSVTEDEFVFNIQSTSDDNSFVARVDIVGRDVDLNESRFNLGCPDDGQFSASVRPENSIFRIDTCTGSGFFEINRFSDGVISGEFEFTVVDSVTGITYEVTEGRFDTLITF
jgi:hypothetical protein